MIQKKLRVLQGDNTVLVANLEAIDAGVASRRFVCRKFKFVEIDNTVGETQWESTSEPETLSPSTREHFDAYLSALKRGDLKPADEETARLAGLPWTSEVAEEITLLIDSKGSLELA